MNSLPAAPIPSARRASCRSGEKIGNDRIPFIESRRDACGKRASLQFDFLLAYDALLPYNIGNYFPEHEGGGAL